MTEDAGRFHFHTAIAALMEFQRGIAEALEAGEEKLETVVSAVRVLLKLLHPMAPHLTEEWWQRYRGREADLLVLTRWPEFDAELATAQRITLVVQVNGKVRSRLDLPRGAAQADALALASRDDKIQPWLEGRQLVRAVYVPDRLLNLVVR